MQLEQMYQEIILDHYRTPARRRPARAVRRRVLPDQPDLRRRDHAAGEAGRGDRSPRSPTRRSAARSARRRRRCSPTSSSGVSVADSMRVLAAFQEMAQGRGQVEPDEDVLGDGVAFAGVARYPARVKCALLGWMAFKDAVVRVGHGAEEATTETAHERHDRAEHDRPRTSCAGAAGMPEPPAAPARDDPVDRRPRGGHARRGRPRAGDQRRRPRPGLRHPGRRPASPRST